MNFTELALRLTYAYHYRDIVHSVIAVELKRLNSRDFEARVSALIFSTLLGSFCKLQVQFYPKFHTIVFDNL